MEVQEAIAHVLGVANELNNWRYNVDFVAKRKREGILEVKVVLATGRVCIILYNVFSYFFSFFGLISILVVFGCIFQFMRDFAWCKEPGYIFTC